MSDPSQHQQIEAARAALKDPGISPEQLHRMKLFPVSLNGIYEACKRGDIEHFRIGKKIVIPTAPLRQRLGMEQGAEGK